MIKLVVRVYITEGVILTLTSFLSTPNGTYNILMVFNITVSGLNDFICGTKFMFP